jgi:hypothetical protein
MVEIELGQVLSSSNTIVALAGAAAVVIAILTFIWRQMKNSIRNDVNKKIDASDKQINERLDKTDTSLDYLSKGHDSIQKGIIKMETSLETIGHSLMKHMIDAARIDGENKADIAASKERVSELSEDVKNFMQRFLK